MDNDDDWEKAGDSDESYDEITFGKRDGVSEQSINICHSCQKYPPMQWYKNDWYFRERTRTHVLVFLELILKYQ